MNQEALRQTLIMLQAERQESLAQFGVTIARTIAPDHPPFTKQYIDMLKRGKAAITDEIARALETLAAMLDGQGELQARSRTVDVPLFSVHPLPPYTVIIPAARRCELPGCRIHFIPASPRQRYCSTECRAEMYRRRQTTVK